MILIGPGTFLGIEFSGRVVHAVQFQDRLEPRRRISREQRHLVRPCHDMTWGLTRLCVVPGTANGKEPEKLILTAGQVALPDNYETVRKDLGIE